ncbi:MULTISPECIES: hypothetical protein [Nocardioides]|uniref:DUF3558 domain-containing protein n=1 Tax=Nocardioides vastitatis TaxID=2568655 RepID=A0ABW0ZEW8_9ACTN|nr:hypothetical protein [Nocardioides sp.]THI94031.1 hypothetical protein E7Z54_20430 [Nocardioides sp.]
MPTVLRALLLSAVLTLVPIGVGVMVADDSPPEPPPVAAYEGTPLADFDTSTALVQRSPFCDRVPPEAVREALGGDGELAAYGNGESTAALPGGTDVAHEYGCVFSGAGGAEARGWLFVPPVTLAEARGLVRTVVTRGCTAQAGAAAYGDPSVAVVCTSKNSSTASFRGLFGDAWLACSLTVRESVPAEQLLETTGRWCVAVIQAASPTAS